MSQLKYKLTIIHCSVPKKSLEPTSEMTGISTEIQIDSYPLQSASSSKKSLEPTSEITGVSTEIQIDYYPLQCASSRKKSLEPTSETTGVSTETQGPTASVNIYSFNICAL